MEMHGMRIRVRSARILTLVAASSLLLVANLGAQGQNNAQSQATETPRAAAPKDLTGYWVSIVTEDWRVRMIVPDKSDYVTVPLTAAGTKVADAWDPAKDQASGNQCRSYGAAAIMRVPGRLHIYWQGDDTLRIDTDSGTQTRLLHFGGAMPPSKGPAEWQGYSVASWEGQEPIYYAGGGGRPVSQGTPPGGQASTVKQRVVPGQGYLKVVTTHMRPGYLRKNGVPYSANATLEEYFDRFTDPDGNTWLTVTTVVTDPQYLVEPFITNSHFKKIPDASGWDPTPCRTDQPR